MDSPRNSSVHTCIGQETEDAGNREMIGGYLNKIFIYKMACGMINTENLGDIHISIKPISQQMSRRFYEYSH
jgi:hypothetical protein